MYKLILLSILQSFLLCTGQVLLKLAVRIMDKSQGWWAFFVHSICCNGWLMACGITMTAAGLLWMYILRHFPFSLAYPLTAMAFVFGMLAGILVFHETVVWQQWVGIGCILIGCYLVAG